MQTGPPIRYDNVWMSVPNSLLMGMERSSTIKLHRNWRKILILFISLIAAQVICRSVGAMLLQKTGMRYREWWQSGWKKDTIALLEMPYRMRT